MVVDHVLFLAKAVVFSRVDEHDEVVLPGPACGVVHLHALSPIDGAILVAESDEERSVEVVESVDGGVTDVVVHVAPEGLVHASLGLCENPGIGLPAIPINAHRHAHHVCERGSRDSGGEEVGLGDNEGCLISAP